MAGDGDCDRWRHEQVAPRSDMATCEARWIGGVERARALLSSIEADDPGMLTAKIVELDGGQVELIVAVTADSILRFKRRWMICWRALPLQKRV